MQPIKIAHRWDEMLGHVWHNLVVRCLGCNNGKRLKLFSLRKCPCGCGRSWPGREWPTCPPC